jgi:uncharacterized protein
MLNMPQPGDRNKLAPDAAKDAKAAKNMMARMAEELEEVDPPKQAGKVETKAGKKSDGKSAKKSGKKGDKKPGKKAKDGKKQGEKLKTARFDARDMPDSADGQLIEVRRSGVHGKGVFALAPIKRGTSIIEYVGRVMSHKKADKLAPIKPDEPNHTFFFQIRDGKKVINAAVGGSAARWINHSCAPNCEAEEDEDGRVFIKSLRKLKPDEELFYSYGLVIDEPYTRRLKKEYECRCGATKCRGTMLAPKH